MTEVAADFIANLDGILWGVEQVRVKHLIATPDCGRDAKMLISLT